MGGQGREAAGDQPDVHVVDGGDAGLAGYRGDDVAGFVAFRGCLQQDPAGLAQQAPGGVQHQPDHDQGGDRVGALEAGEDDHDPGGQRPGERVQVGDDVREGALDVDRVAAGPGHHPAGRQVHGHAHGGHGHHDAARDRDGMDQAADGLEGDQRADDQQGDAVGLSRQNLGALDPERPRPGRGPPGEADRNQARAQRARVGQHVTGIGQQRQRMTDEGHDDLEHQEAGDQAQRDRDIPAAGTGGHATAMRARPPGMIMRARPRLRVLRAAVRHPSSRSGCSASVCWVWVSARSRSIRTCASSRR